MESHTKQNLRYLVLVALLGAAAILFLYQDTLFSQPLPATSIVTDEEEEELTLPEGYLHFTASKMGETSLNVYTYNLKTDTVTPTLEGFPMIHSAVADSHTGVAIIQDINETDPASTGYLKAGYVDYGTERFDFFTVPATYSERDITPSEEANAIAYSAMPNPVTTTDWMDLSYWQVILHVPEEDYTHTINNAAHPQWLEGDTTVVYLKADGVYAYNRLTDTETKLIGAYENLTFLDDIGLSVVPDEGGILVLTVPALGVVDIVSVFDTENVTQIARIETPAVQYTDPVVNPDVTLFAVMARTDSTATVQVYDLSATLVKEMSLSEFDTSLLFLDGWSTQLSGHSDDEHKD